MDLDSDSRLQTLDLATLLDATAALGEQDADLAGVVATYGPPPLWEREEGFATLIHLILEQQVSLQAAQAAYDRLILAAGPLSPGHFLSLDDVELRAIGFSRQKTRYGRCLADAIGDGTLDLNALRTLDDAEARARLMAVKGIGAWTADIYLLMALRRPDVWPDGDLALAVALQELLTLPNRPSREELARRGAQWRPWRAVAARILWHFYLSRRRKETGHQKGEQA